MSGPNIFRALYGGAGDRGRHARLRRLGTRLAESVANPGVEVPEGQIELLRSLCSGATHGAMWLAGSELQRSVTTREFGGSARP